LAFACAGCGIFDGGSGLLGRYRRSPLLRRRLRQQSCGTRPADLVENEAVDNNLVDRCLGRGLGGAEVLGHVAVQVEAERLLAKVGSDLGPLASVKNHRVEL
jgi:hypothetical protein